MTIAVASTASVLLRLSLAEPSEHQSGASQHTGGQPKAGGLQNRECLGVMDDPEMKGD
jgi:hypothetical protein